MWTEKGIETASVCVLGGGGGRGRGEGHEDEYSVYLLLETTTVSMFIVIIFNLHNLIQSKCTVSNHWLVNLHAGVAVGSMPLGNFIDSQRL